MDKHNPMQRKDSHGHDAGSGSVGSNSSVTATSEEATTLEKIWQPLFDNGNPTMRLGQFLRGLAKHLIEDYEPKGSLVVTPAKMMQFFDETRMPDEHYPWASIFGGKMANNSISTMYRKLLCQHHLVQKQYHEAPSIPGLTPIGFETFMTCMIQAHPDTEYERLAKAVQEMPISNADDKTERFPKQLSRRLLPAKSNMQAEQRLISSLAHEPELVPAEREASAMPPPPPEPPLQSFVHERERKPYSQTSQASNAIYGDDEDISPPAVPIERERKPYFAKEGMGKRYDEDDRSRGWDRDGRQHRPDPPIKRPSRTGSGFSSATDPMNIPFSKRSHRMSTGPPPAGNSWSNPIRRSPPSQNGFARSDPFDVGGIPSSQYGSNLHGPAMRDPRDQSMRDPSLRDPSMRDPSMRDPSMRDSSMRDLSTRDPSTRDPSMRDLPMRDSSMRDTSVRDPSGRDSLTRDSSTRDSSTKDFSMRDSSMRDPFMRDPSMRDRLDDDDYLNRPTPPRNGAQMPTSYDHPYPHRNSVNSIDDRRRSWYTGIPPAGMAPGGPGTDGYGSYSGSAH